MEKKNLYDRFLKIEAQNKDTSENLADLKIEIAQILERNAELEIENQHLREHLQEVQRKQTEPTSGEVELSKSKQNLEKLYEEGFHVCSYFYGSRRVDNESCAFCIDIIYGER